MERTYNVPLRRKWLNVPKYKRAKKAVFALRQFLEKHMKSEDVKLGKYVNELLWKHGMKNPPHHVKVVAKKDDKGVVFAELEGAPVEVKEEKKGKKGLAGKLEEKKEEAKAKKEEKEELKAIKKEAPKPAPKAPAVPKQVEKQVTGPANK
ncbi:50S ribosomal protein L31e [Candidatus Woesearchaeota archaeon]|nr:50S ribosomal protein L31e [Candidatus Woesearchaeota archaeon]